MKNNLLHGKTFKRFALQGLILALPQFLIMLFCFAVTNRDTVKVEKFMIEDSGAGAEYIYLLMGRSSVGSDNIVPLLAALFGAVIGIILFRFLASKRAMTVYYGIGVKRTTFFRTVYLAGAKGLFLSVAVPLLLNCACNIQMLGNTEILWSTTAYYFLILFGMNLLGYTVAALCAGGSGTIVESAVNTVGILSLPFLLPEALGVLSRRFLQGSTAGLPMEALTTAEPYDNLGEIKEGILHIIPDKFNPFVTAQKAFADNYNHLIKGDNPQYVWNMDGAVFAVIFITVLVAVLAVCAVHVFKSRKAENCGIPGANKTLNTFGISVLAFYVYSIAAAVVPLKSAFLSALIGLALFFVIFMVFNIFTEHGFIKGLRNWKQSFVPLGATSVLLIVFVTGMFGYSSYIPKERDIVSARVTTVSTADDRTDITVTGTREARYIGSYSMQPSTYRRHAKYTPENCSFYDKTEISKVIYLNKMPAEDKGYTTVYNPFYPIGSRDIAISYTLKDGSTVTRYFRNCGDKAFDTLCLMQNNKFYKDEVLETFRKFLIEGEENTGFSVCSRFRTNETYPELTEEESKALYNAIEKDIKARTAEERFFPKEATLGFIGADSYVTDGVVDKLGNVTEKTRHNCLPITPLTSDMVNTIEVLRELGLSYVFEGIPEVKELFVVDEENNKRREKYSPFITPTMDFSTDHSEFTRMITEDVIDESKTLNIKDEAKIKELLSVAEPYYPTTRGGYLAACVIPNVGDYIMVIPEERAPEYVKKLCYSTANK